MAKSTDDRFDGVLEVVEKHAGAHAKTLIEARITGLGANRDTIGNALSLGSSSTSGAAEKERRNMIRAVLFLLFTEAKQPTALASTFKEKYAGWTLAQLVGEMKSRLPLAISSPGSDAWDPKRFSPAVNPPPAGFRYIVFGMMNKHTGRGVSYDVILSDPLKVRSFALSTSLIGEGRVPTYYPYGLILDVPKENIVSAFHKDQAFKNYRADDPNNPMSRPALNDLRDEVRRVSATFDIATPDDILNKMKLDGDTGYSEIVVLGTGPTGAMVTVKGFFMKVDSNGSRYTRPDLSLMGRKNESTFVSDDILKKMKASNLPIVEIVDKSGKGH